MQIRATFPPFCFMLRGCMAWERVTVCLVTVRKGYKYSTDNNVYDFTVFAGQGSGTVYMNPLLRNVQKASFKLLTSVETWLGQIFFKLPSWIQCLTSYYAMVISFLVGSWPEEFLVLWASHKPPLATSNRATWEGTEPSLLAKKKSQCCVTKWLPLSLLCPSG